MLETLLHGIGITIVFVTAITAGFMFTAIGAMGCFVATSKVFPDLDKLDPPVQYIVGLVILLAVLVVMFLLGKFTGG